MKSKHVDAKVIDLCRGYIQGDISRRSFLRRLAAVVGSSAAASTMLPLLDSSRAWGQQAIVDGGDLRFKTTDEGRLLSFEVRKNDTWKSVPFRTDEQGTSWYVRDSEGVKHPVRMTRVPGHANRFEGVYQDVQFGLSFALSGHALEITATLANKGKTAFKPMTAGMHIGFDSFQPEYPEWNYKLVPKAMRCEPTHHWGHALSPYGQIIGWVCPSPVASYTIDYANGYGLKGIYTANIDFINQLPLPARHPQNLTVLKPGETKSWTVYLMEIGSLDEVKSELASCGDVPIFDAEYYTLAPGQETRVTIFGPEVKTLSATNSEGKKIELSPDKTGNGRTDYTFMQDDSELYTFRAECENGRIAEGSIFVRHPWAWYLKRARLEGLRVKPTQTHHAECTMPFYSYFLARKHFPDAAIDKKCEDVFQEYFPQHYDFDQEKLKIDFRTQDTPYWAGILADRYAATGDEKDLEYAANLVDFLIRERQEESGGYYRYVFGLNNDRKGRVLYTSVGYGAKSVMEVMKEEKKLAETSPVWRERYERHKDSVSRAMEDLVARGDNLETEGRQTYEDGMISCSMTQLAAYALKSGGEEDVQKYLDGAEYLFECHRSLTLNLHPDARVNGSTIRYWETWPTIAMKEFNYNSPCGWSAWKLYGDYYLYLLTGKEHYLRDAFNGLGACVQLIDHKSGRMRWGFTPDPFVYTRYAVKAEKPTAEAEHDWVTGVRGEEYFEQISDWNRSKPIWREKWGIDNFPHEIFKCMEEIALCNAYVHERPDGAIVGYNCRVEEEKGTLYVIPVEGGISRIHLNLQNAASIKAEIGGTTVQGTYKTGMQWIGPGGVPEDVLPL
jgi:hypothetical protein